LARVYQTPNPATASAPTAIPAMNKPRDRCVAGLDGVLRTSAMLRPEC